MKAQVTIIRDWYVVQVYLPTKKGGDHYRWQTVESYKCQSYAKELMWKLERESEMTMNEIYKKYIYVNY